MGVAPRHIRRAIIEIESHFQHLLDEERARGATEQGARLEALRRLGNTHELVRQYAARPELRAWSRRWPSVWFTLVPLMTYLGVGFAALLGTWLLAHESRPYLSRIHIAPHVTREVDLAARVALLWCLPWCVTTAFTLLGSRRCVSLRWPLTSIVLISALASFSNVIVTLTGGPDLGEVGAGIGVSTKSWAAQSMHVMVLVALSFVPLWWTLRRAPRHRGLT